MQKSPTLNINSNIDTSLRYISIFCAALATLITTIVLIGWATQHAILTQFYYQYKPQPVSSAFLALLLGIGLCGYVFNIKHTALLILANTACLFVFITSLLILLDNYTNLGLKIEENLLTLHPNTLQSAESRVSTPALINNILIACALILMLLPWVNKSICESISSWLATTVLTISCTILLGYLYNAPFYINIGKGQSTSTALPTALCCLLLSIGIIAANGKKQLPLRAFLGPSLFSRLIRTIFPIFFIALIIQGWITTIAFTTRTDHVLITTIIIIMLSAIAIIIMTFPIGYSISRNIEKANQQLTNAEKLSGELAKKLANSNKELQQFAYAVSHDLQEPLRIITSYLELIERRYKDKLDQDANDFIEFTIQAAAKLEQMIDDLLTYSRVETKAKPFTKTDINVAMHQAMAFLKMAIDENHAIVTYEHLPTIMADENQMIALFQNLLSNAIKFHKADIAPRVHISAKQEKDAWIVSIRDNGIGIDPKYNNQLFSVFKRFAGKEYPGTGIGLSICKRIIERHHGNI